MFFALLLVVVPVGFTGQLIWTLRSGRLPRLALLPGVSREETPIPFWLYVGGLTFAVLVSAALAATILLDAA